LSRPHKRLGGGLSQSTVEGKGKFVPVPLTKHHAMKTYGGVEVQLHAFLTSDLDGGEGSASHPARFTLGTHWIGGWAGTRASLDAVTKRKIPDPCRESNPDRPDSSLVAIPTELSRLR
jgi:hypothetical protein